MAKCSCMAVKRIIAALLCVLIASVGMLAPNAACADENVSITSIETDERNGDTIVRWEGGGRTCKITYQNLSDSNGMITSVYNDLENYCSIQTEKVVKRWRKICYTPIKTI